MKIDAIIASLPSPCHDSCLAQVIIRNLDDDVVANATRMADAETFWELAARMRKITQRSKLNPTYIIRKARDERLARRWPCWRSFRWSRSTANS